MALISSFLTYSEITQNQLYDIQNPKTIITLIITDLVLFIVLLTLVMRKIFRLWHKGKNQSGRLQNKIILMFCLVAGIPTIVVTVFSTIFFNFGIQSWFDQRVGTAINESVVVAESYFRVQLKLIESDATIMAQDLNYLTQDKNRINPEQLSLYLNKQADDRTLVEAIIFQLNPNKVIAQSRYNFSLPSTLSQGALEEAKNHIVVIAADNDNKIRSLIKLDSLPNCYLLVGRVVDTKVLDHMINTKGAASEYERLRGQISNLQIQFLIIFIVVSLLLLFTAIWLGLTLSSALIKPLNNLMSATAQITEGNFAVNLNVKSNSNDEISVLTRAFNSMTLELKNQREKLIQANHETQAKHHFSEMVLSGVSAGIVALDPYYKISAINPTALNILSLDKESNLINQDFSILCPEIANLLPHIQEFIGHEMKKEIIINRGDRNSILVVRILTEKFLGKTEGYIITFDDVTTLVLAQRSAAWSDVARKVAHEIKNPLTPIHLAAERLKRKYLHEISDTKNFEKYLEIIIKHVKDIGTMVDEFVQFARMPAPEFANVNLAQIVRDAIFSRKCLDKQINYISQIETDPAFIMCDSRQISQVLLNLFKNSEEAIEHNPAIVQGKIIVSLNRQKRENTDNYTNKAEDSKNFEKIGFKKINEVIELSITDNGGGFPSELFDRLTEPYITSKSTGTGLGLAIVKKILDDHKAEISFANNHLQGATIKLTFKESL